MLRSLCVGIGLIMFGCGFVLENETFFIRNLNWFLNFLGLFTFRAPLWITRINGSGRMVFALHILLTQLMVFLKGVLEEESSSLYNFCWKILALPSIHITALRVLENKIATKVNLARREITVDSTVCCFYKEKEETTSRLFFECRVA